MTKLSISLDPEIASTAPSETGVDGKLAKHQYYLDKLALALASERGIKLEYPSQEEAKGARFRFYRARRFVADQGISSFDKVTLTVSGSTLFLRKDSAPNIELL